MQAINLVVKQEQQILFFYLFIVGGSHEVNYSMDMSELYIIYELVLSRYNGRLDE